MSNSSQPRIKTYVIGFILSLALTLCAYLMVANHTLKSGLLGAVVVLAILQLFIQLIFFLHLGQESKPRWNLTVFGFMLIVLLILVGGSLWIMTHLNYHAAQQYTNSFVQQDENIQP